MKFLLLVLSVGAEAAQPIHFQPFELLADCERERARIVRVIPRNPEINFVAICAPVKNAASVEA